MVRYLGPGSLIWVIPVKRYVDWLGDNGAPIILLTSGSSEYGNLTEDEVWRLTADIAEANAGRALFITASNHWKTSKTREFLKHADRVGADAVKVQMDKGLPLDRAVYSGYFDTIEDASDIPLLLLDAVPSVSLAAELAKRPNIVGAKIHNLQWYYELMRATLDDEFAVISAGQMKNMVQVHQVGSPVGCREKRLSQRLGVQRGELRSGRHDSVPGQGARPAQDQR